MSESETTDEPDSETASSERTGQLESCQRCNATGTRRHTICSNPIVIMEYSTTCGPFQEVQPSLRERPISNALSA